MWIVTRPVSGTWISVGAMGTEASYITRITSPTAMRSMLKAALVGEAAEGTVGAGVPPEAGA